MAPSKRLHNIYSKIDRSLAPAPRHGGSGRLIGAFLEVPLDNHSSLTPLPEGGSYGPNVSRRVPCPHWLYVMEQTDELIKVGSTHRPASRYRQLRSGNHSRLCGHGLACRAIWLLGTMRRGEAGKHEYAVHGELRLRFCEDTTTSTQARTRPEWYVAPVADVIAIVESYVGHLDESSLMGLA